MYLFLVATDFQSKWFQLLEFWIVKVVPLWGCYRWWKDGRFLIQKACLKFLESKSANAPIPPTFNLFKAAKAIQCTFVNILPSASGSSKLTNTVVSCDFFFGCKLGNRKQSWNMGRTRTTWSQVMVDFFWGSWIGIFQKFCRSVEYPPWLIILDWKILSQCCHAQASDGYWLTTCCQLLPLNLFIHLCRSTVQLLLFPSRGVGHVILFSGSRRVQWVFRQDKTRDLHGAEKDSSASHEQCMRPMAMERVPFFWRKIMRRPTFSGGTKTHL